MKNFNIADIGAKFEESTYQLGEKTETLTYCDTEMPHHVICQVQPGIAANQFLDIMLNRSQSGTDCSVSILFLVFLSFSIYFVFPFAHSLSPILLLPPIIHLNPPLLCHYVNCNIPEILGDDDVMSSWMERETYSACKTI